MKWLALQSIQNKCLRIKTLGAGAAADSAVEKREEGGEGWEGRTTHLQNHLLGRPEGSWLTAHCEQQPSGTVQQAGRVPGP